MQGNVHHHTIVMPTARFFLSCGLLGKINSKCGESIRIIQPWYVRHSLNYVLRNFRRWLINEKVEQYGYIKRARPQTTNSTTIRWIEKLLKTPLGPINK